MTTVIECENLCKKFRLGLAPSLDRVTEVIQHACSRLLGWQKNTSGQPDSLASHWALRDVNFQVREGEVLGIIGRNGAGKSTLLKVLSRITRPTSGWIRTRGRIASLLEVGTGFHPELTGRENIFLNGSILGMTRKEIEKNFDAIVAFSEVEKFLDTPVKRYSSGMYTRLAFAVAAFLEPEILIVDEVLAVGDSEFQQKCLTKMDSIAKSGRTILFVSHNLKAVRSLCQRAIYLEQGQVLCDGSVDEGLIQYRNYAVSQDLVPEVAFDCRGSDFHSAKLGWTGDRNGLFPFSEAVAFTIRLKPNRAFRELMIHYKLRDAFGNLICHGSNQPIGHSGLSVATARETQVSNAAEDLACKEISLDGELQKLPLLPARYFLEVTIGAGDVNSKFIKAELAFESEAPANAKMTDTLSSDLSSIFWPATFKLR